MTSKMQQDDENKKICGDEKGEESYQHWSVTGQWGVMSPCQQSLEAGSRLGDRVGRDDGCGEMGDVTCDWSVRFTHRCIYIYIYIYCVLTASASQLLTFYINCQPPHRGLDTDLCIRHKWSKAYFILRVIKPKKVIVVILIHIFRKNYVLHLISFPVRFLRVL